MEYKFKKKSNFVILVTGMKIEARLAWLLGRRFRAIVREGSEYEFWEKIQEAIKQGGVGIISYGIAGGLHPLLKPGNIIIGDTVVDKNLTFETDLKWRNHLKKIITGSICGKVIGIDQPVTSFSEKNQLYSECGAIIVDMESHIAARIAKVHGLPCVILRVVADHAKREVPEAARQALKPNGTIDFRALIHAIAENPKQMPSVFHLALDFFKAVKSLLRCNRLLGKGFGFFDL
ncbi:MAG: phosphorylase [Hyphomicrobium sp.]